jgi:hypothetical protein
MTIKELCGYCGMALEDCGSLEECNYNDPSYRPECALCNGECGCDAQYENYRDQLVADYFDSKE